jgi:mono/diheme cytochrome c family protein
MSGAGDYMRVIWKLVTAAAVVGLALQFVRPKIENPPATAELQVPHEVREILKKSCYNCHSNETRLSWFDQVAPAYWLVAQDVKEARRHLNFSEIGKLPAGAQKAALYDAVNQIRLGTMPLPSYRKAHRGSAVTAEQLAVLERYLDPFDGGAGSATGVPEITPAGASTRVVEAAPNGLAFFSDYKNWKPISTTDRGDNRTLRVILGNDVAVKAIADRDIMPWPDGAAFAKVAWEAFPDGRGGLHTGKFVQVEFMVKGAQKYKSTAGWGFGRWKGMDLKPYGKDAHFAEECVGCHTPVRESDYVYSLPVERGEL